MMNVSIYAGTGEGEIGQMNRLELNGELVLTTAQLAKFYGCPTARISQSFLRHKENFVEGKHYLKLEGENLKNLKNELSKSELVNGDDFGKNELPFVGSRVNVLYLWTKRGVARHAKMLNTHTAWEVFELLEDSYFSGKKITGNKPAEKISKNALTAEKKIKFLLQAAKITKDAVRRENLVATAEKIIIDI